ncbi:MAG TPA: phage holin family protein [Holophagaceae bacterium]
MIKTLLRFLFSAIGLLVASAVVPGIGHGAFVDLLAVAVILGLLNASVGALLRFVALVPMVCSFGCFSLVINGLVFWLAGTLSSRLGLAFSVSGFWAGFFGALVASVVASLLGGIFIPKERERPQGPPPPIKIIN